MELAPDQYVVSCCEMVWASQCLEYLKNGGYFDAIG